MTDPMTALLVKVASATGLSTLALSKGMSIIGQGEASAAANGWVLTGGGLAGILVLIWKLVSDHSTVTRERQATDRQIGRMESDLTAARALTTAAVNEARIMEQIAEQIWLEAARGGCLLDAPGQRRSALATLIPNPTIDE